jgi:hypothetical protein
MKVRQGGKIIDVDPFATVVEDAPAVTFVTAVHASAPDDDPVPDGTVDEVVEWVGDDEDRRRAALAAELAADRPRSTLITQLS